MNDSDKLKKLNQLVEMTTGINARQQSSNSRIDKTTEIPSNIIGHIKNSQTNDHASNASIPLFQYYPEKFVNENIDKGFKLVVDRLANDRNSYYRISAEIEERMRYAKVDRWGLFSWHLTNEVDITSEALTSLILSKPEYDVYIINSNSNAEILYENPWQHGESQVTGYINFTKKLTARMKLQMIDENAFQTKQTFILGNSFVGTSQFWKIFNKYLSDTNKIVADLLQVEDFREDSFEKLKEGRIAGQIFSTYLNHLPSLFFSNEGRQFKILKINPVGKNKQNRELIEMADYFRARYLENRSNQMHDYWNKARNCFVRLSKFDNIA
jgi:hypothetical protein